MRYRQPKSFILSKSIFFIARLDPVEIDDLPDEYQHLLADVYDYEILENLYSFQVLAHNPQILQSYLRYGTRLWKEGGLPPRKRQIVLLTVANNQNDSYVWETHQKIGKIEGLSDEEIDSIKTGKYDEVFSPEECILVEYAQAVCDKQMDDTVFEEMKETYGAETTVGVTMMAGLYIGSAHALDALDIQ